MMPSAASLSSPRASSSSLAHEGEHLSSTRLSGAGGGSKPVLPTSKPETQDYDADEQERGSRLEKSSQLDHEEREAQKFKQVSWQGLAALMLVEGVALGTLSFPAVFATLGLVPGIIVTVGIGIIAMYTGLIVGEACHRSPTPVRHFSDLGMQMGGPILREVVAAGFVIVLVLVVGSHVVTGALALSTISDTSVCSLAWAGVSTAVLFLLALPKTFNQVSYLGYVDFVSLIAAVLTALIATGVQTSNQPGVFSSVDWHAFPQEMPSFTDAFLQVTNICFAYSYTIIIPSIFPELKKPEDYKYSIYTLGVFQCIFYTVVGSLGYVFVGSSVASPLLVSAGPLLARIAYGVALPLIFISGAINATATSRYLHMRMFKNTRHRFISTYMGIFAWVALVLLISVIAFVISQAVPIFSDILGIVASLFVSGFTFYLPALLWFFLLRRGSWREPRNILLGVLNAIIFLIGLCLLVAGIYATAISIKQSYASGSVPKPFSCQ